MTSSSKAIKSLNSLKCATSFFALVPAVASDLAYLERNKCPGGVFARLFALEIVAISSPLLRRPPLGRIKGRFVVVGYAKKSGSWWPLLGQTIPNSFPLNIAPDARRENDDDDGEEDIDDTPIMDADDDEEDEDEEGGAEGTPNSAADAIKKSIAKIRCVYVRAKPSPIITQMFNGPNRSRMCVRWL